MPENEQQRHDLILAPFRQVLIERHEKFDDFCNVVCYSLSEMGGLPRLTQALHRPATEIEQAESIAGIAKREREAGFTTLFNFATIFTWGALETAIRDVTVNWLLYVPQSREHDKIRRLKIPFADYEELDRSDRIRYLVPKQASFFRLRFIPACDFVGTQPPLSRALAG